MKITKTQADGLATDEELGLFRRAAMDQGLIQSPDQAQLVDGIIRVEPPPLPPKMWRKMPVVNSTSPSRLDRAVLAVDDPPTIAIGYAHPEDIAALRAFLEQHPEGGTYISPVTGEQQHVVVTTALGSQASPREDDGC